MPAFVEVALVLGVVAAACALPGTFLVLRRMSLVSDAVGHVLLLGIVLAYFATRDVDSPWLLAGAAATGLLAVVLVELLQRTRLVKEDAAIGLVFPALFALGVLLASMYTRNVHLDIDQVLLGQPEHAGDPRWVLFGTPLKPLWIMSAVLAVNLALAGLFFKELKLTTFDPALAASLGFRPGLLHYGLMVVVSVTAVAAFDAVGPVLVVGFFVVPAAAALLLTDRLGVLLLLGGLIGVAGSGLGTWAAFRWDTSVAGTVAGALGLLFAAAFAFAPGRGLAAQLLRRRRQRRTFHETMLAIHLLQHEGTAEEGDEARPDRLHEHLGWPAERVAGVVARCEKAGLVRRAGGLLKLTEAGRDRAQAVLGG